LIGILNFDMGNIGSVVNMFKKIGVQSIVVNTEAQLEQCDKYILPGVGAFNSGMKNIKTSSLYPPLVKKILEENRPILGICLGMQLLFEKSDEGTEKGLCWIPGTVKKFQFDSAKNDLKIPHMGWNYINREKKSSIFGEAVDKERYYYVHSYHVCCDDKFVLARATYGYEFVCSVQKGNIYGMQFHPEKSHKFGLKLFKNFAEL